MNRRRFIGSVVAIGAAIPATRRRVSAESDFEEIASPDHATRIAWSYFNNVSKDTLFSEMPLGISCVVYEFGSDTDAESAFQDISAHVEEHLGYLMSEGGNLKEVSIGRIGDDRIAFLAEDSAQSLWTALRAGSQLLTVLAISFSSNPSEYISEWLEEYVPTVNDGDSLLPEISDMPPGWSLKNGPNEIVVDGTPVATP